MWPTCRAVATHQSIFSKIHESQTDLVKISRTVAIIIELQAVVLYRYSCMGVVVWVYRVSLMEYLWLSA
jgi:hypothetical protein